MLPSVEELDFAFWQSGATWTFWRLELEADRATATALLLTDPGRFARFVNAYNLFRLKDQQYKDGIRHWLVKDGRLDRMLADTKGHALDALVVEMRKAGFQGERSFLSKVSALLEPEIFLPWDRFAKAGATLYAGRAPTDYSSFLAISRNLLEGELGEVIREHVAAANLPDRLKGAFPMRMLDIVLMRRGGRWVDHFG